MDLSHSVEPGGAYAGHTHTHTHHTHVVHLSLPRLRPWWLGTWSAGAPVWAWTFVCYCACVCVLRPTSLETHIHTKTDTHLQKYTAGVTISSANLVSSDVADSVLRWDHTHTERDI